MVASRKDDPLHDEFHAGDSHAVAQCPIPHGNFPLQALSFYSCANPATAGALSLSYHTFAAGQGRRAVPSVLGCVRPMRWGRPVHAAAGSAVQRRRPLSRGIDRNIPFALLGLLVIVLFYRSAKEHGDRAFRWMWLTIVLSFGFYIPVVLWADVMPMIGMLMIPKTCAYVWTVLIGYSAMKQECGKRRN